MRVARIRVAVSDAASDETAQSVTPSFPFALAHRRYVLMSSVVSKVKPLLDRILVKRVVAATHSPGGVLLPESAQKHLNQGVVVSVGPGRVTNEGKRVEPSVKAGDTVLLPEYGGSTVTIDKEDLVLYRDEDLLGVIEK